MRQRVGQNMDVDNDFDDRQVNTQGDDDTLSD